MPEMPEVETIRRTLAVNIEGRTIVDIKIRLPRLIKYPKQDAYIKRLCNRKIEKMGREGKYLIMHMSGDMMAVFHLRMTGQLYYADENEEKDKYTKIVFSLDNGTQLIYADMRTFGTLYAIKENEREKIKGLYELGHEPLAKNFTISYLANILKRSKSKIKVFLLNQKNIAGLGNIYVDESLFLAGINPEQSADSLSVSKIKRLHAAINKVISAGIRDGGTTFRDYVNGNRKKGQHQNNLYVYGQDKKPCQKCGTIIKKIKVGGRGTCFCPKCQKLK